MMVGRPKLAVVDANAEWTQNLFSACNRFADVLLIKPRDFRAHFRLHGTLLSDHAPREVAPHVWEQRLSMPPWWMFSLWRWASREIARAIRKFAGNELTILSFCYPQYLDLAEKLKPDLVHYYNFDDYADHWPEHRDAISVLEDRSMQTANLITCTANLRVELLRRKYPHRRENIFHVSNGCSPELMADKNFARPNLTPAPLASVPSPRVGYIGTLNWRFDHGFLAEVARLRPKVQFVLGGKTPAEKDGDAKWREGFRAAKKLSNIHFIGWVDRSVLGDYLNAFDALFMCYSNCRFNTNACPAKLWDYMATGLPIVANDRNPETLLWREVIQIGKNPEAFAEAVTAALHENPVLRERRLDIARAHTWDALSRELEAIFNHALSDKNRASASNAALA
jgi:glycosyltransferase involved in cell wall biosynthesis